MSPVTEQRPEIQRVQSLPSMVTERFANILRAAMKDGASDIHLGVNKLPHLRLNGDILPITSDTQLRKNAIFEILKLLYSNRDGMGDDSDSNDFEKLQEKIRKNGSDNFACSTKVLSTVTGVELPASRIRVCVVRDLEGLSMVIRVLPDQVRSLDQLGFIPEHGMVEKLKAAANHNGGGLFLVTGPTGSGKTTTLSSTINDINRSSHKHIITIEDPCEYVYPQFMPRLESITSGDAGSNQWLSLIRQREVHRDTPSFYEGCKDALRMDPDIILVGEIRDVETMRAVAYAAETGHLVFSTLHTKSVFKTLHRILSLFPADEFSQVCTQLANTLVGILSQRLLKAADMQGRCLCYEWLPNNEQVANSMREIASSRRIDSLANFVTEDVIRWNDCLKALFERGRITKAVYDANFMKE